MRRWIWVLFLSLGFLWGSSYLWIKIGLDSLPPMTLIAGRLAIGGLFLAAAVLLTREALPRSPRTYGHLLVMAVINIVLPPLREFASITRDAVLVGQGKRLELWDASAWDAQTAHAIAFDTGDLPPELSGFSL